MRLAYLVGTYPAVSHTFIAREVEELRRRGVEVHTFSVRRPDPSQLLDDGDRRRARETPSIQPPAWGAILAAHVRALVRSPRAWLRTLRLSVTLSPGGARATLWQLFYFVEAIVVWDWCRRRHVERIHAHFANSGCWIAMLAADFSAGELGFSFTMHGPTEFDDMRSYRLAEKVHRAGFVACISDFCRSQLMRIAPPDEWSKLAIVRCGIDLDAFAPVDDRKTDATPGPLQILCVGRLIPTKGQRVLIAAIARLRADGIDAELALIGDGPERGALVAAAAGAGMENRVVLHGSSTPDQVRSALERCDVFCLPSFAEGVPVAIMEAMAMQRPVVSTRVMGIPELVCDERDGLLVAPGSVDELAAALRRLADDPALRRRLGVAGREKILADHELSESVDRLLDRFSGVPR